MVAGRGIREELREARRRNRAGRDWRHLARSVVGIPDEDEISLSEHDVDPSLQEGFPRWACEIVRVQADPWSQITSVRQRIQIEVRFHERVDGPRARGGRRHGGDDGLAKVFLKPLEAGEEEDLV